MVKWNKEAPTYQDFAEEAIQSEENFAALLNVMPDPVCIIDGKGKFLDISRKAIEILGYSKEELVGKNVFSTNIITSRAKANTIANLTKRMLGLPVAPYVTENILSFERATREVNFLSDRENGIVRLRSEFSFTEILERLETNNYFTPTHNFQSD